MSTITKEQLRERARQKVKSLEFSITQTAFADSRAELEEELELARIALASLEAEAVAYIFKHPAGRLFWALTDESNKGQSDVMPVYTAPPAPVSVPDGMTPKQASRAYCGEVRGYRDGWNAYRAAMLQGAEQQQNQQQNIPENIPGTLFKPVADLYGLTSPTGGETSFTFDAVEARDFIDGGWSCQEYVELERFQEAVSGNSPVIPDGWVACSERMPETMVSVLVTGTWFHHAVAFWDGLSWCDLDFEPPVTHWMPLPAEPQQEVTQALAKGMERYGDAMQKLADSGD